MGQVASTNRATKVVFQTLGVSGTAFAGFTGFKYVQENTGINARDENDLTSLMVACDNGDEEKINELLLQGAHVNLKDKKGFTPLVHLFYDPFPSPTEDQETKKKKNGREKLVQLMLERGASVEERDEDGWTPLMVACKEGQEGVADILLSNGADPNAINLRSYKTLFSSVISGKLPFSDLERVLYSLDDPIVLRSEGLTPLSVACKEGNVEVIKRLILKGVDPNAISQGNTVLTEACKRGDYRVAQVLLEHGANPSLRLERGYTPLMFACMNGHDRLVELLTSKGARLDEKDEEGKTPMIHACICGRLNVVKTLISMGCSIHEPIDNGFTPLIAACSKNQVEVAKFLLSMGANPNTQTRSGEDAMSVSSGLTHLEVSYALYQFADEIRQNDILALVALFRGNEENANVYVSKLMYYEPNDKDGLKLLTHALNKGFVSTVKIFFSKGLDLNAKLENGKTALMIAVEKGHLDLVNFLLSKNVDVYVKDQDGKTAVDHARSWRIKAVLRRKINH